MKTRALSLLAAAALFFLAGQAEAGLFDGLFNSSGRCGKPRKIKRCRPVKTCCKPVRVTCCRPKPTCCRPQPACSAPAGSMDKSTAPEAPPYEEEVAPAPPKEDAPAPKKDDAPKPKKEAAEEPKTEEADKPKPSF